MARYLLQRLAGLIFVLFAISVITFTLMHAVPGGPWDATARNPLPEETRTALAHEFGFDRPLYEQYTRYMWSALHMDFGVPYPALEAILQWLCAAMPTNRSRLDRRPPRSGLLHDLQDQPQGDVQLLTQAQGGRRKAEDGRSRRATSDFRLKEGGGLES